MEHKKREVENGKRKRNRIIIIILISTITLISIFMVIGMVLWLKSKDKSYEVETITEFSYFKLYENEKYGVMDTKGNILVEPQYDMLDIPNPSKPVFIGYFNYDSQKGEYQTEVINEKSEKILTRYMRSATTYV